LDSLLLINLKIKEALVKKSTWFGHLTPFLVAIFPILSLANENLVFVQFNSIIRSLLISVSIASIFYLFFYLILRDQNKSAILTALLVFILLTYGNVYLSIENRIDEAVEHRYLLGADAVLLLLVGVFVIFGVKDAKQLNLAILTGGSVIVIYLLISIGIYEYRGYQSEVASERSEIPFASGLSEEEVSKLPDIYLILLDGHTRSDVLKNVYDYDNSEFIDQLEGLGFWVADCSQSNYPITNLSLTSLFEMDYLNNIYSEFDNLVFPPLNNTTVFQILNNHNYSTVTFNNFVFEHFDIKDDIRFSKEDNIFGSINEFEKMLVDISILRILIDMEGVFPNSWVRPFEDDFYLRHYRDTLYALETLPELSEMDENIFVYAHLLVTHDPFVFMPDGSFYASKHISAVEYRNSVEFIDTTLPEIVEEIISNSEDPPIIIIMGDHGPSLKGNPIEERVSILFAIFLQGEEPEGFYEEISLVNVFRLIFNFMFDAKYELIEDKSYDIWNTSELGNTDEPILSVCNP
jgi:hypothetical protein